ncbi:hypothetical protein [Actinosynnema sp. NPDC023587]|uniref:hypothetical protein n=1 Tax=Actinosynnema sp. NPDC023587 TaxID=3154695 RepID=UPI0033C3B4D2
MGTTVTTQLTPVDVLWRVGGSAVGLPPGFVPVASGTHADARPVTLSIGVVLLGELVPAGLRALRSGFRSPPGGGETQFM